MSTMTAVKRRTTGKTVTNTGKAKSQDIPQELSQICKTPGARPTLRKVLMPEIRQVMMHERNKGSTTAA
jgi:hypothetical protein